MCWRRVVCCSFLCAALSSAALAKIPDAVREDFSPLAGLVLLERGGEILLDLTAETGGRVGDIFSVVAEGTPVKHPQTGELLGSRGDIVGSIQIVQLRPGFSIARRLTGDTLLPGTKLFRFDQLKAGFFDSSGRGEGLFVELRAALPHLQWQEYVRVDAAESAELRKGRALANGLLFLYDGRTLEIRDSAFALLHEYRMPENVSSPRAAVAAAEGEALQVAPVLSPVVSGSPLTAKWLGAGATGLPVGIAVADFDGDGQQEIVRAFEDRIEVGRIAKSVYTQLWTHAFRHKQTAIAVSAWDLNANGRAEVFVTTVVEDEVRAEVFEFAAEHYGLLAANQPWFVNLLDLPGEGPVLLGQKRDRSYYGFSAEIFRLVWKDGVLHPGGALSLPEKATIYSLAAMPAAGPQRFAGINADGRIAIFGQSDGELWVSEEKGYSETGFQQADVQNPNWDAEFLHRVFLPTPLISGPEGSLLSAMNFGRVGSDRLRQMKTLRLSRWQWQNQRLAPLWQEELEGYVPALTLADADNDGVTELVLLIAHPNSLFSVRKSVIKLFEFR